MEKTKERYDKVFKSKIINLPNIKITSNQNHFDEDTTLYENEETSPFKRLDDIVITILFSGNIKSKYQGINTTYNNTDKTSSFIYGPFDNQHYIQGGQFLDSMSIGVSKGFFYSLLQDEDPWIETLINNMEKNLPFSPIQNSYHIPAAIINVSKEIRSTNLSGSLKTIFLQAKVYELLFLQLETVKNLTTNTTINDKLSKQDIDKLNDLKAYVESNYLKDLTLDSLARTFGLNTFKLKTGFKILYQKSVFELIRNLRMDHALKLLLDSRLTVGEVADRLGYEHIQHFSLAFKKHFGESPKHYKH